MESFKEIVNRYKQFVELKEVKSVTDHIIYPKTHVIMLLDLSPSLWDFDEIGEQIDFKFKFLIQAIERLFKLLDDQLMTIFFINSENLLTFIRNHHLNRQNIQIVYECLIKYIQNCYRTNRQIKEVNYTIQSAMNQTLNLLRYQDSDYVHKKYIIFSDFTNFGYDVFSHFMQKDENSIMSWMDTQGYSLSVNGIFLSPKSPKPFSNIRNVIDYKLIQNYLQCQNGDLYDGHLLNEQNQLLKINELKINYKLKYKEQLIVDIEQLKINRYDQYKYCLIGKYEVTYQDKLIQMKLSEGFKLCSTLGYYSLSIRVNPFIKLIYALKDDFVQIMAKPKIFKTFQSFIRKQDKNTTWESNLKDIFEQIKQRDILQLQVFRMMDKVISLDETFTQLVKLKAFENQRFINRNFAQHSLLYVIKNIDVRQYQDQGEDFRIQSLYRYIRDKIKEVANKSIGNCLLYVDDDGQFIIIRVVWHTHSLLRLICIYQHQELLQKIEQKVQMVIKRDPILCGSLIQFDKSIKSLLCSEGEQAELCCNPEYYHLEKRWEWDDRYIWKLDEMYRILASMRVKLGYIRVPSSGGQYNKFYVQQYSYSSQSIIIVQHLFYDINTNKIKIRVFTENVMMVDEQGPLRDRILQYFMNMQEQERSIIQMLYSHHSVYRQALAKKLNNAIIDYFVQVTLDPYFGKTKSKRITVNQEESLKKFREFAQKEISQYTIVSDFINYDCIFQKAYKYSSIQYQLFDDDRCINQNKKLKDNYFTVLQQLGDYVVFTEQKNMLFKLIGQRKLLGVSIKDSTVTFWLICLDYIEKNLNVPQFLNTQGQTIINNIIIYMESEFKMIFAKELHILCNLFIYTPQVNMAIEGCAIQKQEVDVTEIFNNLRMLFDPSLRLSTIKSLVKLSQQKSISMSITEESPARAKTYCLPNTVNKKDTRNIRLKIWTQISDEVNEKFNQDLSTFLKQIPDSDLYYYIRPEDKDKPIKKLDNSILYMRILCLDFDNEKKFESFSQAVVCNDFRKIESRNKERHAIQFVYYYSEVRSFQKLVTDDVDQQEDRMNSALLQKPQSGGDISSYLRVNRWTEQFKKQLTQLIIHTSLELKRYLPVNEDSFRMVQNYIEQSQQKQQQFIIQRNFIENIRFQQQFNNELMNQNSLFQFVTVDEYCIFKMNYENCNNKLLDDYQSDKECIGYSEQQFILPFWLYIKFKGNQIELVWIPKEYSLKEFIEQLLSFVIEIVNTAYLQLIIEDCRTSQTTHQLQLKLQYSEIDPGKQEKIEQQQKTEEQPQKAMPILGALRRQPQKKQTGIFQKENKQLIEIPFVGWRIFFMYYGYRNDLIGKLIRNTFLFNNYSQSSGVTFFGFYEKQTYIIVFQEIRNFSQLQQQYPEFSDEQYTKKLQTQNIILMNVYGVCRNQKQNKMAIDYFYNHILKCQDEEIVSTIATVVNKNPKLNKQDFSFINDYGQEEIFQIKLNDTIQDLNGYLTLLKQNLEKVFVKYELIQKLRERSTSDLGGDALVINFDNFDNSFLFTCQKFVNSKVKLIKNFGEAIALLFIKFVIEKKIITSVVVPKLEKRLSTEFTFEMDDQLPTIVNGSQIFEETQFQSRENQSRENEQLFLQFQLKIRGSMDIKMLQIYLQTLVKQVELEYFIEHTLSKQCHKKQASILCNIRDKCYLLKNYSFHLHHLKYPLYYDQFQWPEILQWIQTEVQQEFQRKTNLPNIVGFEKIIQFNNIQKDAIFHQNPNSIQFNDIDQQYLAYTVSDQLFVDEIPEEQQIQFEMAKHQINKRNNRQDSEIPIQRSLLFYILFSPNKLEVFAYNIHWEILYNINTILQKLSKWSIIRYRVAQKMKNELCGAHQVVLHESFEQTFNKVHSIYQNSFINDLHKISTLENNSKEDQNQNRFNKYLPVLDQGKKNIKIFNNTTQCIEYIVQNKLPQKDVFSEVHYHLVEFYKIPFLTMKSRKFECVQTDDFLHQYGTWYLAQQKEDFITLFQKSIQTFVYHFDITQSIFNSLQITQAIEHLLKRSIQVISNIMPIYLFKQQNADIRVSQHSEVQMDITSRAYRQMITEYLSKCVDLSLESGYQILYSDKDDLQNYNSGGLFIQESKSMHNWRLEFSKNDFEKCFDWLNLDETEIEDMQSLSRNLKILRKQCPKKNMMFIKILVLQPPFIVEKIYIVGMEGDVNKIIQQNEQNNNELEQQSYTLLQQIGQMHLDQIMDQQNGLNQYVLLQGYLKYYQKYEEYPSIKAVFLKINIGHTLEDTTIGSFIKFIQKYCNIYNLRMETCNSNFYLMVNQQHHFDHKWINYLEFRDKKLDENISEIDLYLDQNHMGSKILNLMVYWINKQHVKWNEDKISKNQMVILETMRRAHKNYLAQSSWIKIKQLNELYINSRDLHFLSTYCFQTQSKFLANKNQFEQIEGSYYECEFQIHKFPSILEQNNLLYRLHDQSKFILIADNLEQVFIIIDINELQQLSNIRVLYLFAETPWEYIENCIFKHYNRCASIVKQFLCN